MSEYEFLCCSYVFSVLRIYRNWQLDEIKITENSVARSYKTVDFLSKCTQILMVFTFSQQIVISTSSKLTEFSILHSFTCLLSSLFVLFTRCIVKGILTDLKATEIRIVISARRRCPILTK